MTSNVCVICNNSITTRQQSINCSTGSCTTSYHIKCYNANHKCIECKKQNEGGLNLQFHNILEKLEANNKISINILNELKLLRKENEVLKSELNSIRIECSMAKKDLEVIKVSTKSCLSYSDIMKTSLITSNKVSKQVPFLPKSTGVQNSSPLISASDLKISNPGIQVKNPGEGNCKQLLANSTSSAVEPPFILVERKRKSQNLLKSPIFGTKVNFALKTIDKKNKKIFISRFDVNTGSESIKEYIKTHAEANVEVFKLKTKYNKYSSFCVSFDKALLVKLTVPEFWPAGCLILPFKGQLKTETIIKEI